jgi:hypothetical protein
MLEVKKVEEINLKDVNTLKKDETWVLHEFSKINLGDKRLNKRLQIIANNTAMKPTASINQAEEDAYSCKAAYRFYANERVTPEAIMEPHEKRTVERMMEQDWCLCLEDTVYYHYGKHMSTKGLGHIGRGELGLIQHHALVTTLDGLPLGVLHQNIWSRKVKDHPQRQLAPIEEKESYKWFRCIDDCEEKKPSHVNLVHVADREADIYLLLNHLQKREAYYVIRASDPREIQDGSNLIEHLNELTCAGHETIRIEKHDETSSREAVLSIYYSQIVLNPSSYLTRQGIECEPHVTWVVYAIEENPPTEKERISWVLLTNVAVNTLTDALQRLDWYRKRWLIEVYHKVLKSGCLVEDCRLASADKLRKYIALNAVIGWRILWMRYVLQASPDAKCTTVLTKTEYRVLYSKMNKTAKAPENTVSVKQAIIWVARLGGFLGRKNDKEPGVITLWRGWQRLQDYVDICNIILN